MFVVSYYVYRFVLYGVALCWLVLFSLARYPKIDVRTLRSVKASPIGRHNVLLLRQNAICQCNTDGLNYSRREKIMRHREQICFGGLNI